VVCHGVPLLPTLSLSLSLSLFYGAVAVLVLYEVLILLFAEVEFPQEMDWIKLELRRGPSNASQWYWDKN